MPKVWKEAIRPGTYFYNDPETGQPRKLVATPESVNYWFDTGKQMLAAGLSIPIPIEHQPDAMPRTATEKAADRLRNNAGEVAGFELRKVTEKAADGSQKEVDALFALADIQDVTIAPKLAHSIKWTSPYFTSFMDGNGKEWQGVIGHLALTSRPRITKQEPFPNLAAAMSLAGALVTPPFDAKAIQKGKGLSLSRAGLLVGEGSVFKPAYPVAFSLWAGAKLAMDEFPKKEEKKPEAKKPEDGKVAIKPDEKKPEGDPAATPNPADPALNPMGMVEQSLVDPDGDIPVHEVICDLLETMGITMADDCTAENFLERLYQATMDKMKADKAAPPPVDPNATLPTNPAAAKPEPKMEQPPIYMSLEAVNKIADPTTKAMAMSLHALQNSAIDGAKAVRKARLALLLPKLKKDVRDKLAKRAESAAFSLGADGKVNDEMGEALGLLEEALNIDVPDLLTNPHAALAVMPHPKEPAADPRNISEERRQAVVNEQYKSAGKTPPYAVNGAK